ncbi:hypothetical protein ACP3TJ_05485 [Desulforudis sp. 1088]
MHKRQSNNVKLGFWGFPSAGFWLTHAVLIPLTGWLGYSIIRKKKHF